MQSARDMVKRVELALDRLRPAEAEFVESLARMRDAGDPLNLAPRQLQQLERIYNEVEGIE